MLGMPEPTAYDLRFRFLGIPVRVHPLFWLFTALLAGQDSSLDSVLIWIVCVFISILVHEFGHGLMARAFHFSPSIVLYSMGGLCASQAERQTPWQRLAVLAAGPGAGFLLGACVWGGYLALGEPRLNRESAGWQFYGDMLYINLGWSIINLAPIWPLDGGQITGVVLSMINPRKGMNWAHVISLLVAGGLAVLVFQYFNSLMFGLFFAFFAIINFQILQAHHHAAKYGALEEDADWWKR
jgi:stage IV sporulation protein FB